MKVKRQNAKRSGRSLHRMVRPDTSSVHERVYPERVLYVPLRIPRHQSRYNRPVVEDSGVQHALDHLDAIRHSVGILATLVESLAYMCGVLSNSVIKTNSLDDNHDIDRRKTK